MRPIPARSIPSDVAADLARFRADTGFHDAHLREAVAWAHGPKRDLATSAEDFGRQWTDRAERGRRPEPEAVHASWSSHDHLAEYPALRRYLTAV